MRSCHCGRHLALRVQEAAPAPLQSLPDGTRPLTALPAAVQKGVRLLSNRLLLTQPKARRIAMFTVTAPCIRAQNRRGKPRLLTEGGSGVQCRGGGRAVWSSALADAVLAAGPPENGGRRLPGSQGLPGRPDAPVAKPLFACPVQGCGRCFARNNNFAVHLRAHSREKFLVCPYEDCGRRFLKKSHMKVHLRTHTGEKPFGCPHADCERRFPQRSGLASHLRTHAGERNIVCPYKGCRRRFALWRDQIVHLESHSRQRPIACTYEGCSKRFLQRAHLRIHLRTHTGERPFACPYDGCESRFSHKGSVVTHQRTHTGARPFVCPWPGCRRAFAQSNNLASHQRVHYGGKSFVCFQQGCGKAFRDQEERKEHCRIHIGENPSDCPPGDSGPAYVSPGGVGADIRMQTGEPPVCDAQPGHGERVSATQSPNMYGISHAGQTSLCWPEPAWGVRHTQQGSRAVPLPFAGRGNSPPLPSVLSILARRLETGATSSPGSPESDANMFSSKPPGGASSGHQS